MDSNSGQMVGWQIQKFSTWRSAVFGALVVVSWSTASWGQEMTAEKLLQANRKTWASIRTFEANIEARMKWVNDGVAQSGDGMVVQTFWARGDAFERFSTNNPTTQDRDDRVIRQGEESILTRYKDQESWSKVQPATKSGLRDRTPPLLRELPPIFAEKVDGLNIIFAEWKLSVRGPVPEGKEKMWIVHAINPHPKRDERGTLLEIEISFNASRGCLIQRMDGTMLQWKSGASENDPLVSVHCVCEVTRFRSLGEGVDFPEQFKLELLPPEPVAADRPKSEFCLSFTLTKLAVNSPLSEAARNFRFPQDTIVTIYGQRKDHPRYALWGPNNVPVRNFANSFELNCFQAEKEGRSYASELVTNLLVGIFVEPISRIYDHVDRAASRTSASLQ